MTFHRCVHRVAVLAWAPDGAQLERNGQTQRADSVDALIFQLLGTAFPLAALFDWLHQRPTTVAGWQLDNTAQDQGRLVVRRTEPAPAAELRIKLQTP